MVDVPGLVEFLVALVPMDMSVVGVGSTVDVKASETNISDVHS